MLTIRWRWGQIREFVACALVFLWGSTYGVAALDSKPIENGASTPPFSTEAQISGGKSTELAPDHLFREANALFTAAGKVEASDPERAKELYHSAALRFEMIISMGVSNGRLCYNLGNTYYKTGQIGKAILFYKQAMLYAPGDANLRHNLEYVRALRLDKISPPESGGITAALLFWHSDLSTRTRQFLVVVFATLFWCGLIARRFARSKPYAPRWLLSLFCAASLAVLASLWQQRVNFIDMPPGVIVSPEVTARKGNGTNYQPAFQQPLHEGTEVQIIEQRQDWLEVKLMDGRLCWLPAESIARMRARL